MDNIMPEFIKVRTKDFVEVLSMADSTTYPDFPINLGAGLRAKIKQIAERYFTQWTGRMDAQGITELAPPEKRYTQAEVEGLLEEQRINCYNAFIGNSNYSGDIINAKSPLPDMEVTAKDCMLVSEDVLQKVWNEKEPDVEPKECVWSLMDEGGLEHWESNCGYAYDQTIEIDFKHCPRCGKPIKVEGE